MKTYPIISILYAISSLANEGPTRILLNTLRHLDRTRYAPAIATFTAEKESSLLADFERLSVPVHQLSKAKNGQSVGLVGRFMAFRSLLSSGQFDVVHAHCPRSLFYVVSASPRNVRTIYTAHVYPEPQFQVIHGPVKGRIIATGSNIAMRFIDKPIACADSVASEYLEKRSIRIDAVNNGIEEMDISGLGDKNQALKKLGLDPSRKYFMFVGRLSREKRVEELVRAFTAINTHGSDLIVVGGGPEEAVLREIAGPTVHLVGFHQDIRPFLAACDFYISPSSTEGLANSLLEAMSVGMPSLLSDIPSHQYVVQRSSGYVGEIFDPTSEVELERGIMKLMERDSAEIRSGIRKNFNNQFHARVMTRGYESVYMEMMA